MVISCCAYGCTERFLKEGPLTFHRFPKDAIRRKLWEKETRRENFTSSDSTRICSKHFEAECFEKEQFGGRRLKPDAVPTKFDFPDHLKKNVKPRKRRIEESEHSTTGNLATTVVSENRKKFRYVGDFTEEDMESRTKARKLLTLAKSYKVTAREKIQRLSRRNRSLVKMISNLKEIISEMKKKSLIIESAGNVLKSSGTASREEEKKKDHIPLEPTIEIKEEPLDYNPTPSTSTDTANEEFILPHEENTWTPPVPAPPETVVEPQFTLSVASLAVPNDPENSDGEQLKKKRKIETSTFVPSTNGSEVRPQSPVYNFSESSNPGSSKDPRKDQFDVFGEYIAAKLRSLDRRSCAYAQKAIGDIIFEAEMGKFLDEDSDSKDLKNCAS